MAALTTNLRDTMPSVPVVLQPTVGQEHCGVDLHKE
jgi:hypothetical protein